MKDISYRKLLFAIKENFLHSRIQASKAVNSELIKLYWNIGKLKLERQNIYSWGKSIVERLAQDLQKEFPLQTGFSTQNRSRL